MVKSLGALETHLQGEELTTATFWKIKRIDGVIFGLTDHDKDIPFDVGDGDGLITYKAAFGYTRTAIETTARMNVDNLDVEVLLDDLNIKAADLRSGLFDGAEIKIFLLNYESLSDGTAKLRRGTIGTIKMIDNETGITELRGMLQSLSISIVDLATADCRVDLGDTKCKVRLDPPAWTATTAFTVRPISDAALGSVVKPTVENDRHFKCTTAGTSGATEPVWNLTLGGTTADGTVVWTTIQALTITTTVVTPPFFPRNKFQVTYTGDAPDKFFTEGVVEFTSGVLAGQHFEVKLWDLAAQQFTLFLNADASILNGVTLKVSAGCDKKLATCRDTFDNVFNMRGFPYVPGENVIFNTPDAR